MTWGTLIGSVLFVFVIYLIALAVHGRRKKTANTKERINE